MTSDTIGDVNNLGKCYRLICFNQTEHYTALRDRKHYNVYNVLKATRPSIVLDIGCNRDWFSQLAAILGCNVVAADVDEVCADQLFEDARTRSAICAA